MENTKLKDLRNYISRINPVCICMNYDLSYETYRFLREVPEEYDDYFVYGIGTKEPEDNYEETLTQNGSLGLIEIVLSKEKKEYVEKKWTKNYT